MKKLKRYCFALDLKPGKKLIKEYETYHKNVWPKIIESIKSAGIEHLEIFRTGNRLFMIMEVNAGFSFKKKKQMDDENSEVQKWEKLMWNYQQALPTAKPGEKWKLLKKIFSL